jgi:hypothetical protein
VALQRGACRLGARVVNANRAEPGQEICTRRVIWPLLSQYVVLPDSSGSSGAGWAFPSSAIARQVMVCSPGDGVPQSRVQNVQANASPAPSVRLAGCLG